MYLTLLTEDQFSEPPNQEVLAKWASDYEITAPSMIRRTINSKSCSDGAYPRLIY